MRLLLVEDDQMIGEAVLDALRADGYTVDWLRDGTSAGAALHAESFDLVLLDLGLPGRDGVQVLQDLRGRKDATPVLVLTARDGVRDRIRGLDAGADDYLLKPFDLDELGARIRALLRRSAGRGEPVFEHGPLRLDPATHQASLHGEPVTLSAREWALLTALLARPGAVLSRAQLEEKLYGWKDEVISNAVEVHIHSLRKKLGQGLIRNLRGVGWFMPRLPP
jgi:DNA-binding response OmpR family regulator